MWRPSRFRHFFGVYAVLINLAVAAPAMGADAEGKFAILGMGRLPCQSFTASVSAGRQSPQLQAFLGFIEGFYSAVNVYEPETFDAVPFAHSPVIGVVLNNYCQQNPQENLVLALRKIAIGFRERRLTESSPLVQVTVEGRTINIYQELLVRMQKELAEQGYYSGEASGEFNPEFQEAISMYQLTEGLGATGLPDQATVWQLLAP